MRRRSAAARNDILSFGLPFGLPRWEARMSFAPLLSAYSMVGSVSRIRVSSVTCCPSSDNGTLKSTRMNTRWFAKSRSRMESVAIFKLLSLWGEVCVGFDLDQPLWVNQPTGADHGRRRLHLGKELSMSGTDCLPIVDVGEKHARADDVAPVCLELFECRFDDLEAAARLRLRIAWIRRLALEYRRGAGDMDVVSDTDRPAKTEQRLESRAAERALFHHSPLEAMKWIRSRTRQEYPHSLQYQAITLTTLPPTKRVSFESTIDDRESP